MKLLINPAGGMAGDMFSAALISAGADFKHIQAAMAAAGKKLGSAEIQQLTAPDNSTQLDIHLHSHRHHLSGTEAKNILTELFEQFDITDTYRQLGVKILDILVKAEIRAHKEFNIVVTDHNHTHSHPHSHDHDHDHDNSHSHDHAHGNNHHHPHPHKHKEDEAFLHEAQDIVIDIMGAVTGMQALELEPSAQLTAPISVGGGHVVCSHGRLSIPAPATTVILQEYQLQWTQGPIEVELLTPTGAAILAALGSEVNREIEAEKLDIKRTGIARGTKILDIPPLKFFVYEG